jgi:hypothetical protein
MDPADLENELLGGTAKVMQDAPTVISGLATIANNVQTDLATHTNIVKMGSDIMPTLATSLKAIAASGTVGNNDASNINAGVGLATEATTLAEMLYALEQRLAAFYKKIF